MRPYRKIWIEHFGKIPVDEDGRSFEIHHIDGDRTNNDISNLMCVSIKEHYDIHLKQGDYSAASYIASRMKIKPEDLKIIRSKATKKAYANGMKIKHSEKSKLLISEAAKKRNQKLIKEGKHNFITDNPVHKRIKTGNHNWQKDKNTIPCYDKKGNYLRIPSDLYHNQVGPKDNWEYVHNTSTEGKKRKLLNK